MDTVLSWLFLGIVIGGLSFFLRGKKDLKKRMIPWVISSMAGSYLGGFVGEIFISKGYTDFHVSPLAYSLIGSFILIFIIGRRFSKSYALRRK